MSNKSAFAFYCLVRQMRREQKMLDGLPVVEKLKLEPESQKAVDAWIERTEAWLKEHPGYEG